MSNPLDMVLVSHDAGLLAHWQRAFRSGNLITASRFNDLQNFDLTQRSLVWIDMSLPDVPAWGDEAWTLLMRRQNVSVVAASSHPEDSDAIEALDAGCTAYCHAFSDAATLVQVARVVQTGHVWIGKSLMQRLIKSASHIAVARPAPLADWSRLLTQRERKIAILAANGASNHLISLDCKITERTVKAHLGSVFEKLNLTDRLQLALRVHGIHPRVIPSSQECAVSH